jgi:hypothetical protein
MPAGASAEVTIPIPPDSALIPPPIATMPSAGPVAPAPALIADPVTPEAVWGSGAMNTFPDPLPRSTGGTVTYQVCEEGAPVCSGFVSVVV